jgi:hypothetical protein
MLRFELRLFRHIFADILLHFHGFAFHYAFRHAIDGRHYAMPAAITLRCQLILHPLMPPLADIIAGAITP